MTKLLYLCIRPLFTSQSRSKFYISIVQSAGTHAADEESVGELIPLCRSKVTNEVYEKKESPPPSAPSHLLEAISQPARSQLAHVAQPPSSHRQPSSSHLLGASSHIRARAAFSPSLLGNTNSARAAGAQGALSASARASSRPPPPPPQRSPSLRVEWRRREEAGGEGGACGTTAHGALRRRRRATTRAEAGNRALTKREPALSSQKPKYSRFVIHSTAYVARRTESAARSTDSAARSTDSAARTTDSAARTTDSAARSTDRTPPVVSRDENQRDRCRRRHHMIEGRMAQYGAARRAKACAVSSRQTTRWPAERSQDAHGTRLRKGGKARCARRCGRPRIAASTAAYSGVPVPHRSCASFDSRLRRRANARTATG